jgi:hypothetical protein
MPHDPQVTALAAIQLAQRLHETGASPEEIAAAAERFAAEHAEDEEPAAVSESIEWVWLEEARRQEGEVWKGPSGRYFTIKSGHVVPAKTPGGEGGGETGQSNQGRAAAVHIHPDAQRLSQKLFGKQLSEDDCRDIACAPEGSTVTVSARGGALTIAGRRHDEAGEQDFNSVRKIYKSGFLGFGGAVTCQNIAFGLKGGPKGAGAELFAHQVETMAAQGVQRIEAHAAGEAGPDGKPDGGNGYYTWPRLGYSGKMSSAQVTKLPPEIQKALGGKRDVRDLFDLPGGAEAWLTKGSSLVVSFDMAEGSRNREALKSYMADLVSKQ